MEYHIEQFGHLLENLAGHTEKCVFSFLDMYPKIKKRMAGLGVRQTAVEEKMIIAKAFSEMAHEKGIGVETCAEDIPLEELGINHGKCIDDELISRILGCGLKVEKDKYQRQECRCMSSIDIGSYNTCMNGCAYCYANMGDELIKRNFKRLEIESSLLCSSLGEEDKVKARVTESLKERQMNLLLD